jgi:hypothetical protein
MVSDLPNGAQINETKTLVISQPYTILTKDKDYKYILILSSIGAGGKNPFSKAAYITVSSYKLSK